MTNVKKTAAKHYQHPLALVESTRIGEGTRIWAFAHVMKGAVIGNDCNVGDHAFVESGAKIGNGVTIKNGVAVWEGVTVGDFAFLGPNAVFTNDLRPRSPRFPGGKRRYEDKTWLAKTKIGKGAIIGANATIVCGVTIGDFAMIVAGTVVTKDVPAHALWIGVPGKLAGFVCECGDELMFNDKTGDASCKACRLKFALKRSKAADAE